MDNFWSKVNKTETCWLWTGGTNGRGVKGVEYGLFKIPKTRKNMTAHRFAFTLANGAIESHQWVLHKCDNPLCVNPDHLFLGDVKANVADMISKGRQVIPDRRGEKNGRSVMDAEKVGLLRLLHGKFSVPALTKIFGIGKTQIYRIVNGQQWQALSTQ